MEAWTRRNTTLVLILGLLLVGSAPASGQAILDMDVRGPELTREELGELLTRLEEAANAPGYSREIRNQAAREASYVRERLESGDFRVGDRIVLQVRGEPQLSDTLTVTGSQTLDLPEIGPVSLAGVLRSELQGYLTETLGQYLREPDVRASALIRIAVLGAVGNPGFFTLPASALLEDALMRAGGPGGTADLGDLRVQRGDETVWEGELLQRAMVEGRTLDQLSLQAGDRIIVPAQQPGFFSGGITGTLRALLITIPPLIFLINRLSR